MSTSILAYTFDELTGKARERALKALPDADCDYTLEECMESLQALCKLAGVTLKDWSIGPDRSWLKVDLDHTAGCDRDYDLGELAGPRAVAWIENNIFGRLRTSWRPATVPLNDEWARIHGKYARRYEKPGEVPSCPLTGVCFDEDLLSAFRGRDMTITLRARFESLAGIISKIAESELEYQEGEGREERAEAHYDSALFDGHGHQLR